MPIRAYCTICSDFFDHSKDVAAIYCGHTFHYACLLQWFQSAPTKTCPQCRKQVSSRHIINKLFFDIAPEDEGSAADPESLQNELDRMKAAFSEKERGWREKQKAADNLRETIEKQRADLERVRREIGEKEMLCTTLRVSLCLSVCVFQQHGYACSGSNSILLPIQKQMQYLESQHRESEAAKEEAKRLRVKMKTYER
uniref:TRAF-interacting protein n=1 Tax=Astyanax mexicanus TaxID=7994 RepID=A0A8B9HTL0_ASTMX